MATLPNQTIVGGDWISLNTLFGVLVGNPFSVMNRSHYNLIIQESNTEPLSTDYNGKLLMSVNTNYCNINIWAGAQEVWVRNTQPDREVILAAETD